jgi:hypothetical protein
MWSINKDASQHCLAASESLKINLIPEVDLNLNTSLIRVAHHALTDSISCLISRHCDYKLQHQVEKLKQLYII